MTDATVLSRMGNRLSSLLSDETAAAAKSRPDGSRGVLSAEEFEARASKTAGETGRTLAGAVNFIGLSKIKERLGERWEKLATRADEVARRAIEHRLDDVDVYTRQGELQYLVLFAHLSEEHARIKCSLIAEEITKRLLGDEISPEPLEVKTMVSQAQHDTAAGNAPDIAMLAARLASEEPTAKAAAAPDDDWWDGSTADDPLDSIRLAYRPLWDVRRHALATYVCTPLASGAAGRLVLGDDEIAGAADAATVSRLDLMMQRRVIGDLRHLLATGRKLLLCLPVHFETMASNARRMPYLDRCRRGIPQGGERCLAFEIVGAPAGMPQGRLLELSSSLKRHGRCVFLRATASHSIFRHPSETGISAIGLTHQSRGNERLEIEAFQRFAAGAKKSGATTYIRGLRSLSLVTAAIGAGFDFVDGEAVASLAEKPANAYQFDIEDLFARQMGIASTQAA